MKKLSILLFFSCAVVNVKAAVRFTEDDLDATVPDKTVERHKRSTCAAKYQIFTNTHSACLPGSSASVVSLADQTIIVNKHNTYRAAANPSATNMLKMKWDDELAMIAQKWAENCVFQHDKGIDRKIPGRFSVGQNLAKNAADWSEVVDLWHGEVSDFVYGSSNFTFSAIGHYTQVMWATTSLVGCGVQNCYGENIHACNYGPAGNIAGIIATPYESGAACSKCSSRCVDSALCDCDSLACRNGGTIDVTSCTCTCQAPAPLYSGNDCALTCTGTSDKSFCSSFTSSSCPAYADWCPHLCNVCPYGDDSYADPVISTTISTTSLGATTSSTGSITGSSPDSSASKNVMGNTFVFLIIPYLHLLISP